MSTTPLAMRFDPQLFDLIPHRSPMLLLNKVNTLSATRASALITIDEDTPFCNDKGVPAWIGIEYMGQTAALIAGYQLQQGSMKPRLGFLLGTRRFQTEVPYFTISTVLVVSCLEKALVGDSLATFDCQIHNKLSDEVLATASLSVYRKPLDS